MSEVEMRAIIQKLKEIEAIWQAAIPGDRRLYLSIDNGENDCYYSAGNEVDAGKPFHICVGASGTRYPF